ncbi:MAG TPA: GNAT family N-acetyltransferase [Bryobacteraceae bacterium]|nr:GNAT family N-acetyltransferase [Bryobacteraceae bacterium]
MLACRPIESSTGRFFSGRTARTPGCAGLRPYRIEERIYALGFHLRPEHQGRGLAEEASRAIIDFAFDTIGAKALFAGHHPENHASRRILSKLGFRLTHEEFFPPTGLLHPSYLLEFRSNGNPS